MTVVREGGGLAGRDRARQALRSPADQPGVIRVMANAWRSAMTFARRTLIVGVVLGIVVLAAAVTATARSGATAPAAATASPPAAMSEGAEAPLPAAHPQ